MRKAFSIIATLALFGMSLSLESCVEQTTTVPPEFDAQRALRFIEEQVAFGPRVPGSVASENCKNYLISYFDSLGYTVTPKDFTHVDYLTGKSVPLTNLLISQMTEGVKATNAILLCAHWDSRPRCEQDPDPARRADSLPAANDGASGVAMLMELAALIKNTPTSAPIEFALFDGEDWGREGDVNQYSLGAKEFAKKLQADSYRYAILFDIIAHPNAKFRREQYSDEFAGEVTSKIWAAAKTIGVARFIDSVGHGVIDDHLPLLNAGLPTVDIIDMNYKYWHTTSDTPDKCDSAALHELGSVIVRVLYQEK